MESDQMLWDMLKSHIGHQVCIVAYGERMIRWIFALNVKSAERSFLMRKSIPLPQGKNKIGGAYSFFRYVPSGAFSLDFTVPRATYYGIL